MVDTAGMGIGIDELAVDLGVAEEDLEFYVEVFESATTIETMSPETCGRSSTRHCKRTVWWLHGWPKLEEEHDQPS